MLQSKESKNVVPSLDLSLHKREKMVERSISKKEEG